MTAQLDVERQRQARQYGRQKRALFFGQAALGLAYLAILILAGLAVDLRDALAGAPGGPFGVVAAFFLVLWLVYTVVTFPLNLIGGWSLPRRYEISVQSLGQWLGDWLKGEGIGLILGLILIEIVYTLLRLTPHVWWLIAAAIYVLFVIVLAQLGPVLLLPLFFKLTPLPPSELTDCLKELARRAGTRVRGIYSLNMSSKTTAANAMLAGLGRTRRVILGDTLLDCYTPKEIKAVFAHELGHQVHNDIARGIAEQAVLTLISLYVANLALVFGVPLPGYRGIADVATMPYLALVLGIVGALTTPLVNGLSRRAERAADCYALTTTDQPEAFVSTMIRLANQNLAEYNPPHWVEALFYDHPSIAQRVGMAERYQDSGRCG